MSRLRLLFDGFTFILIGVVLAASLLPFLAGHFGATGAIS